MNKILHIEKKFWKEYNNHKMGQRMMSLKKCNILLKFILFFVIFSNSILYLKAQNKTPDNIAERFFMPALQMGYINHNAENISEGLIIQTSLEYRTKYNLLFRINYDDFSGRLNLNTGNNQIYNAKIPMSEFIGGFGYRLTQKRHNYFLIAQTGIRFYENPVIENFNGNLNIKQAGKIIGTARYTFGYEYEVFNNVFLNSEIFIGHFLKEKDFWSNKNLHYGITMGISARLF